MAGEPTFRKYGLGWAYDTEDDIHLSVDYLKRKGDELHGILTIESGRPGEGAHVHEATHNFSGLSARSTLARHLSQRLPDVNWPVLLEQFCVGVMRRANTGEPFMPIGGLTDAIDSAQAWAVEGLIPEGAMTWWYGSRASVKSQTAALLGVCKSEEIPFIDRFCPRGRVGILDYEDSRAKWDGYTRAIARGLDIPAPLLFHRVCTLPIDHQVNQLARLIDNEGLSLLIIDSFGLAAGSAGEHSSFDEVALRFGTAVKTLNITTLVIDHISHAARLNQDRTQIADPFGSQYKLAIARAGYEIRKEQSTGSASAQLGIFDAKHRRLPPIALDVKWSYCDEGPVISFAVDEAANSLVRDAMPLLDRVCHELEHGAATVATLSDALESTPGTLRKILQRGQASGKVTKLPDERWGLSAAEIYNHVQGA